MNKARRGPHPLVCAAAIATLLAGPAPALAQPAAQDRQATDGIDRPVHELAGEGDATSIELNPALLTDVQGFDGALMGYRTTSDFTRGGGVGAFAATNLGFGLATGVGVQFMRPGLRLDDADFDAANNPDVTKLSFALAGDFGGTGIGVGVHGIRANGQWLRPDLDIGALARIFNYGSIGVNARLAPVDLDSSNLPSHVTISTELAVRPLGTHHLELAGGLTQQLYVGRDGNPPERVDVSGLLPRGRVAVRYQGWALKAEVEQIRTSVLDPLSFARVRGEKALRGGVALEGSWDIVTGSVGVHAGISDGLDGIGFTGRLHSRERGRVFWPRQVGAERFDIASISGERDLLEMLERLSRAEAGGERSVVVVDARGSGAGWASLHELRQALIRVRNAGGHVFAYLENTSLKDYYIASVAEQVYLHPAGSLETYGLSSTSVYLRGALDKLGVKAEVVKVDEYKSAGERFDRTGPSEPDKAQRAEIQRDHYAQIVHDIAQARGLSLSEVHELFDDAPYGPNAAVALGLVDEVVFRDELLEKVSDRIGASVEFEDFHDTRPRQSWAQEPYVAVVLVDGTIVDGKSRTIPLFDLGFSGGDTVAKTLRDLRDDRYCRGVILRVNSPGGSALASDVIWREVKRTAEAHEQDPRFAAPIVVSMGDVAASGGYYVAMGAPTVLADPMTITGSIGVISIHFDVSGLLETLGISSFTLSQGKNADIGGVFAPYSADQRERVEASIRRTYDLFRERVAEGRGITVEKVDDLGRGHVYSGTDALDLGLVDRMGGMAEALEIIREQANIPKRTALRLRVLPKQRTLVDLILESARGPGKDIGAVGRAVQRKRDRAKGAALRGALPRALDEALARLPLSLLFLPQDRAHAIVPNVQDLH